MSIMLMMTALAASGEGAALEYPCHSAPLTATVRSRESAVISAASHHPVTPRRIDYLLQSGAWKMVWTTPPQEERNVYLFRKTGATWRLVDTWHGDLGTDDPQAGLDWASKRHVPKDLTDCFGTVLVNHP